jgi:hypothetical protein
MSNIGTGIIHDYGFLADKNSNLSLPGSFTYGDLVTHPEHGDGFVDFEFVVALDPTKGVVIYNSNGTTHASGFTYQTRINCYKNKKVDVPSESLKRFTRKKFLLWRHPSGEWMHGKNGAIGAAIRYAAMLFMSIYGATQLKYSSLWALMVAVPLVVIGLMLYGTMRNFEGKQF